MFNVSISKEDFSNLRAKGYIVEERLYEKIIYNSSWQPVLNLLTNEQIGKVVAMTKSKFVYADEIYIHVPASFEHEYLEREPEFSDIEYFKTGSRVDIIIS